MTVFWRRMLGKVYDYWKKPLIRSCHCCTRSQRDDTLKPCLFQCCATIDILVFGVRLCIIITFLIYMYCTLSCQTYRDSDYQVSRVFSNRAFRVQISDTGLLNQLIICEETNPLQFYMQDCYKIEDQMPGV